jgi:hypothetical protein
MSKTPSLTSLAIADKKAAIAVLKTEIADMRAAQRLARTVAKENRAATVAARKIAKENKAFDRAAKKAARIAKLEAKLIAMKSPPVGRLAIKAAKKPSKVTVTKMAA